MFGSSQWMYSSGAAGFYDTEIDGSLRFNDNDSAYLTRTNATADDDDVWTWSAWVKRGNIGLVTALFSAGSYSSPYETIYFTSGDILEWRNDGGGIGHGVVQATGVLRDPSAWYHIVVARNAGTVTIYVNGEDRSTVVQSITASTRTLNDSGALQRLGASERNRYPFDGYMAEVNFIDGTALNASSFGETKSGVWIPKAYSGSYGTNGFHLEFAGNANDSSGNGNNFTASNIAASDYVLDSPTNNFNLFNPLQENLDLYEAGVRAVKTSGAAYAKAFSTIGISSGKWYFEFYNNRNQTTSLQRGHIGLSEAPERTLVANNYIGAQIDEWGYFFSSGGTRNGGVDGGAAVGVGYQDIAQIDVDMDAGKLWFGRNNVWINSGDPATGTNPKYTNLNNPVVVGASRSTETSGYGIDVIFNSGQDSSFAGRATAQGNTDDNGIGDFYYAPPSGFLALCTANLTVAEAVDPAEDNSPQDYFNTVLYTGNGSTRSISGVGFSPDWIWFKGHSSAKDHISHDIVRGVHKQLFPHTVGNEETQTNSLTAFNSDGWSMGDQQHVNQSGVTYAAWCWDAGSSTVSNSDGATTSQVRANPDSGVSIVGWDAPSSGSTTVGHGLSSAPEMVICKIRNVSANWQTWHTELSGGTYTLFLNGTGGEQVQSDAFGAVPTSSVLNIGSDFSGSGRQNIVYAMHSVEGFSAFGKYIGNGSSDGPFVYTGFRPAFVITKPINTASSWCIHDSARTPANTGTMGYFKANTSDAELFNRFDMDLLSNGFKIKSSDADVNHSGGTVIYMAFAENPFKYANAR